ncbi:hypothetical protein JCM19237_344 [Photobacterium aphoticum]|uniref:Uncharacterized protein n=1 Tax=Photobacterium aphoticum TaxID=754436 RepID=A0A090R1H7_9GAMM|nr:hypothetical protein JCM19237_344 [Photobacterium aphoticum]
MVDIQLKYHATNDTKRATIPLNTLYEYAIACRDHVQLIDNKLTIIGEKPTRPVAE